MKVLRLIIAGIALCLSGCSGAFKNSLDFNPTEPLRVAVLPFAFVEKDGTLSSMPKDYLIDNVNVVSSKLGEAPPIFLQKIVQTELEHTSLDVYPSYVVNAELSHHGFGDDKGKFYLDKIHSSAPQELCKHHLPCDAVLYGKITKWDRDYLALQTVARIAFELKLVAVKDGKVLFDATAQDADSRGITKGPTGFSNLLIEPISGLDNEIIADLARRMVRESLQTLYVKKRPEYLKSMPPVIFASSHDGDVKDDGSAKLSKNASLTVLAYGSGGNSASFSIGKIVERIPMTEVESMEYMGEYIPLESEHFENQPVFVSLTDQFGRESKQQVGKGLVSR